MKNLNYKAMVASLLMSSTFCFGSGLVNVVDPQAMTLDEVKKLRGNAVILMQGIKDKSITADNYIGNPIANELIELLRKPYALADNSAENAMAKGVIKVLKAMAKRIPKDIMDPAAPQQINPQNTINPFMDMPDQQDPNPFVQDPNPFAVDSSIKFKNHSLANNDDLDEVPGYITDDIRILYQQVTDKNPAAINYDTMDLGVVRNSMTAIPEISAVFSALKKELSALKQELAQTKTSLVDMTRQKNNAAGELATMTKKFNEALQSTEELGKIYALMGGEESLPDKDLTSTKKKGPTYFIGQEDMKVFLNYLDRMNSPVMKKYRNRRQVRGHFAQSANPQGYVIKPALVAEVKKGIAAEKAHTKK